MAEGQADAPELARRVLDRLERIETLERAGAPPAELLDELRELLAASEAWARAEGGDAAEQAAERVRLALSREMIAV